VANRPWFAAQDAVGYVAGPASGYAIAAQDAARFAARNAARNAIAAQDAAWPAAWPAALALVVRDLITPSSSTFCMDRGQCDGKGGVIVIGLVWALGGLGFALTGSTSAPPPPVVVAVAPPPAFAGVSKHDERHNAPAPGLDHDAELADYDHDNGAPAPVADCSVTWTASQVDPMTGLPVTVHGGYDGTCAQAAAVVAEYPGAVVTVLPQ